MGDGTLVSIRERNHGAHMLISAEQAFWLLEFYRNSQTQIAFGGKIMGEEAACAAVITYVWRESQSIGIKLFSDDGEKTWDRLIPMQNATFNRLRLGEASFEPFEQSNFHSVLIINFPDGTTMFLAEESAQPF